MNVLEKIYSFLAPDSCVFCQREGALICDECTETKLVAPFSQCYGCSKSTAGFQTCPSCRKTRPLSAMWYIAVYDDACKKLIHEVKFGSSRSGARLCGKLLSGALPYLDPDELVVTYCPTTTSRVRERSFDQARLMAESLAASLGCDVLPTILHTGKKHQIGSSKQERIDNAKKSFVLRPGVDLRGKQVLIIDDVMTTGASLDACARLLKKAGARQVLGTVFARPIL